MKIFCSIIILILYFLCIDTFAQIYDTELLRLINISDELRNDCNEVIYNDVLSKMEEDELWTPMTELGPLLEGECRRSENVNCFMLNSILTRVNANRKFVTTHDYGLNGEDKRYRYSLYERSIKSCNSVTYQLSGREGNQTFVIVPFDKKGCGISAYLDILGEHIDFVEDKTLGILVANFISDKLQYNNFIKLNVMNNSKIGQSFILINYNSRDL